MYWKRITTTLVTTALLCAPVFAQEQNPALVAALKTAATNEARIALLRDDQFVFNFLSPTLTRTVGAAGTIALANTGNFPALVGNGMALALGSLDACGLNTPHVHPRATEFNFAVNGTLRTGILSENGVRFIFNNVSAGSATVFPRGAIHFEMNLECTPMIFVAAFNDEDPGVGGIAQRFFGLPPDIVDVSLGDIGVVQVAEIEAKIPNNVAFGVEECLKRCGITRGNQPTSQRQPRLPDNALPSGFSGPPVPSSTAAPPSQSSSPSGNFGTGNPGDHSAIGLLGANNNGGDNTPMSSDFWADKETVKSIGIALIVINGVFVIGILTAVFIYLARKRGTRNTRGLHVPLPPPHHDEGFSADKQGYYDPYTPPRVSGES